MVFGGALLFTAVGFVLGAQGFAILDLTPNASALSILAELTLALLLFSDAASADLKELRRSIALPRRLLLVGLPLTILLGMLPGVLFLDALTWVEIALLATILAPTDAALGKAVVTDESVPNRIRTSLNVESGLNDGICVPIFLAFLAFATNMQGERTFGEIASHLIVRELGIGVAVGALTVCSAAILTRVLARPEQLSPAWRLLLTPSLALVCFCTAQALGGSGFIAAFVGGMIFGGMTERNDKEMLLEAAESIGDMAALLTWVMFGATVVGLVIEKATWEMIAYAALSLTIVRMLPVWVCLRGTEIRLHDALFMGWFGPRGLASIVFAIMAIEANVPGVEIIAGVVACAVLLSVICHGLTAKPFSLLLVHRNTEKAVTPALETSQSSDVRR